VANGNTAGLEFVNRSRPGSPAASVARQVEDMRAAPSSGRFPLTPTLFLGERASPSRRGDQSRPLGFHCAMRAVPSPWGEGQGEDESSERP